ncbi:MAG: AAA family ATPase [Actinomycetota bacterium]|nr:AAA family ATPase [Actinomycetota bacterium]
MPSIRLGIVGKGGVGKTTVAGLVARAFVERGRTVVAIDTDSNPNLGLSLGLTLAQTEAIPVLPRSIIVGSGGSTTAERLVADYGRPTPAGPTLLSAIRVAEAGAGCTCGGHATVRGMLSDALSGVDVVLVDMEAGLEHLSRSGGTLAYADVLLVVCEPTRKSVLTATRTAALAEELGIPRTLAVGNKAQSAEDVEFFTATLNEGGLSLATVIPFDQQVARADRAGSVDATAIPAGLVGAVDQILDAVADAMSTAVQ